jgi:hypothetical protein
MRAYAYLARETRSTRLIKSSLTAAGHAFAFLTVAINLADVTTDVVVAVQFFRDGDTVWAWLVVASLIIAHIVYTVAGALNTVEEIFPFANSAPKRFLVAFVVAQFLPVLHLAAETWRECKNESTLQEVARRAEDADDVVPNTSEDARTVDERQTYGVDSAAAEELDSIAPSLLIHNQISASMSKHLAKYVFFYIESAVEAAPQAVIQLLAITFLGRASTAQMVSLCCSLFSITSKAVVLSQAYDVRVMVFKFMLAAHDVFSAFYLFSTLLAIETVKQTTFFGLDVSWLGYAVLLKWTVYVAYAIVSGILVLCAVLHDWVHIPSTRREFRKITGLSLLAITVSAPALIALEAGKLAYVSWLLHYCAPARAFRPVYAVLSNFTLNDDGLRSKLRHVVRCAVDHIETGSMTSGVNLRCPVPKLTALLSYLDQEEEKLSLLRLRSELAEAGVGYDKIPLTWLIRMRHGNYQQKAVFVWVCLGIAIVAVGQFMSFLYPFINAASQFQTHNPLQTVCFFATCVALIVCALLARYAWWMWAFSWFTRDIYAHHLFSDLGTVSNWIADYYAPSQAGILAALVPSCVLPSEVTMQLALFLAPRDVWRGSLTIKDCNALKGQLAARGIELKHERQPLSAEELRRVKADLDDELDVFRNRNDVQAFASPFSSGCK